MQQELLVNVTVWIGLVIKDTDGSKHPSIRPDNGEPEIGDHPRLDFGGPLPLIVLQGILDEQWFAAFNDSFAEGADVHRKDVIDRKRVLLRVAGCQNSILGI